MTCAEIGLMLALVGAAGQLFIIRFWYTRGSDMMTDPKDPPLVKLVDRSPGGVAFFFGHCASHVAGHCVKLSLPC